MQRKPPIARKRKLSTNRERKLGNRIHESACRSRAGMSLPIKVETRAVGIEESSKEAPTIEPDPINNGGK